jgi:spermidine synthase
LILYQYTNKLVSVRYLVALEGQTTGSLTQYWLLLFCIIAVTAGATLLCSGLVFPSILSINSQTDPAGKSVGRLLAINGLGGLIGCELANSVLISQFGIYGGFIVLAIIVCAAAVVVCCLARFTLAIMGLLVAVLGFVTLTFQQFDQLQYVSPNSKKKYVVEQTSFGPEGVLLVVKEPKRNQDQTDARSLLLNGQYILGSSGGQATVERRQLLLPWVLHSEARNVCSLGLATGISASGLEVLENPPRVTAVELSDMVADLARESFAEENLSFFERPGNRIVCEDGRTFVAATESEYDLIVADLFRPHGVGEGRLFSIEHYRNVKRSLTDDGMFCHWLPAHQLNEYQFRMIAATFMKVFPNTLVVNGGSLTRTPTIGLCAWKDGRVWEADDLLQKITDIRKQKDVTDKLVRNAHLMINGVLKEGIWPDAPVNTLDNAKLELNAGRFWLLKDLRPDRTKDDLSNGFLSGPNWKRFLLKLREDTTPVLDPEFRQLYLKLLN